MSPLAGALVDRWNRQRVLVATDLLAAASAGGPGRPLVCLQHSRGGADIMESPRSRRQDRHHLARHRPGVRGEGVALRPACLRPLRAGPRRAPARPARPHPRRAASLGGEPLPAARRYGDLCRSWAERLKPSLADTEQLLNGWIDEGKSLLFEGAQGTLLDIDHGTYPYVTSSNSTAGGACTGTGVPPTRIDGVIGVLKAYTTRVGGGPWSPSSERRGGEFLRQRGNEYGTVTGRPRRCGWLDTVVARYASSVNGVDAIALTKLDVLDDFDEIPVCTGYRVRRRVLRTCRRAAVAGDGRAGPAHMKGWKTDTVGILDYADLPPAARDYVDFIEQEVEAPVALVSTGPRREETIVREDPHPARLTSGRLGRVLEERHRA